MDLGQRSTSVKFPIRDRSASSGSFGAVLTAAATSGPGLWPCRAGPCLVQETRIVPRPGARLAGEQVRAWCAIALAAYKVPAEVEFRTSLPYNQTGKLMKQELEREERARASAEQT